MKTQSNAPQCSRCGAVLAPDAPEGLCPRCLMALNLATQTEGVEADVQHQTRLAKPPPEAPLPPSALNQHFPQLEILECLGRGGMGVVYKARQPKLNRIVALKILAPEKEGQSRFGERFVREAQALARLSHPNIVTVYDFGETGGMCFLLMEFIDGMSLRQLMQSKKLRPEEALVIVPKICDALQFAHEQGVVHRDIKPENVLVDKQGRVKIADFGIAKLIGKASGLPALTDDQQAIGTPHYMAPEQVEKPHTVDHRADIYSLGVVFYEMLTGELPLGKFQPPSRKIQVDAGLDEVVLHALEKEPERRYQHVSEVKSAVETFATEHGSSLINSPAASVAADHPGKTWQARLAVVGVRQGRRVVNWPGVTLSSMLMSAGLFFGAILAQSLAHHPAKRSSVLLTLAILVPATIAFAIYFGLRRQPLDRLVPLDPPVRPSHAKTPAAAFWAQAARWAARILGTLLLAFFGLFVMAEGLPPLTTQPEGVQLSFAALSLMMLGLVVGWKREGTAALLVSSGWTLWQISENRISWTLFQVPLLVALLYAGSWWALNARQSTRVLAVAVALLSTLGLGRLVCPANVFIDGRVTDASTGDPLPNAELRLLPQSGHTQADPNRPNSRANGQGRFTLYVGWYTPARQVSVSAPDYLSLQTNLGPRMLGQRRLARNFSLQPVALEVSQAITTPDSRSANPPQDEASRVPAEMPINTNANQVFDSSTPRTPREIIAEWLKLIRLNHTQEAWTLTLPDANAGWGPDLTSLREFARIRPAHQLHNQSQAMVISQPFLDNAGSARVFYAWLQKRDGRWLVQSHGRAAPAEVASQMRGFMMHPAVQFDVHPEELVGDWSSVCHEDLILSTNGTGTRLLTGPGGPEPGANPESFTWEVHGKTWLRRWTDREEKLDIAWVDDDSFQVIQSNGIKSTYDRR
jgi:tRNA A-37 threonylcarbamoyl transferase component Bud32